MKDKKIRKVIFTFDSTDDRDTFMDAHFKDRQCSDAPGLFFLTNGEQLGVFCNKVTYYKDVTDGEEQTAAEYYYDKGEFKENKRPVGDIAGVYNPPYKDDDWYREQEHERSMEEDKGDHWIWE